MVLSLASGTSINPSVPFGTEWILIYVHMYVCVHPWGFFFCARSIWNASFSHALQRFIVLLYAKFCSTSKCHSSIHILLYFPFDLFLLAGMPTHSLQHQITSHAISLTILWPEYLAQVSASSLNLPSTLSPYSSICWWKLDLLCIAFTFGSNSAVCFWQISD